VTVQSSFIFMALPVFHLWMIDAPDASTVSSGQDARVGWALTRAGGRILRPAQRRAENADRPLGLASPE